MGSPLPPLTYKSRETIEIGTLVEVTLRGKSVSGYLCRSVEAPAFACETIRRIEPLFFDDSQRRTIRFIAQYYSCSLAEAAKLFHPFQKERRSFPISVQTGIHLSQKQEEARRFIASHPVSLLFGDTGSGKTEIYMKCFEEAINEGKSALFLMPEISLTPQMRKRLKAHFGELVEIWHSRVTKRKRAEILERIREGRVRIVAGARSALFLPLADIGMIVVDEEHDDSYKASSRPRYHARDLAIYLGEVTGARVVLGSATPSVVSYAKFPRFRLKGAFFKGEKRFEFLKDREGVDERIFERLQEVLESGHQAIFFLPTRANYKYLTCFECGRYVECPFCSVGMSIHRERNALRCHYCNYMERIVSVCPHCHARSLRTHRIGTAQVVEELSSRFPDHRFKKFDRDEITTEAKLKQVLKDFNEHKIDVLVGTQMLSKGHDYHDIRLAVVLGIDTILAMADYRARERAMSLLLQVAGRTGRRGEGKVMVQTNNEDFFARYIDDYERFLEEELPYREGLYPPYKKLMKFLIAHKNILRAKETLEKLQRCLLGVEGVEVVGFGEAPIPKIAGKHRFQVLLRSDSARALLQVAHRCAMQYCEVDIDPVSFS